MAVFALDVERESSRGGVVEPPPSDCPVGLVPNALLADAGRYQLRREDCLHHPGMGIGGRSDVQSNTRKAGGVIGDGDRNGCRRVFRRFAKIYGGGDGAVSIVRFYGYGANDGGFFDAEASRVQRSAFVRVAAVGGVTDAGPLRGAGNACV